MPSVHSSPFYQMTENPVIISLLRGSTAKTNNKSTTTTPTPTTTSSKKATSETKDHIKRSSGVGNLLKMFKLVPMLTSGCKMVGLLGHRPRRTPLLKDSATTTGTIFGYRKGRVSLAVQEDPHCMPVFVIELPLHTAALNREMQSTGGSDDTANVRIAFESETKTHRKKLLEEFVWAVFCNGKKLGYSIRRMHMTQDELHVMHSLRGVSTGAGVLPPSAAADSDGDLTYMRARFDRVVGSKDSEALHMINPDAAGGPELSIFFLRSDH